MSEALTEFRQTVVSLPAEVVARLAEADDDEPLADQLAGSDESDTAAGFWLDGMRELHELVSALAASENEPVVLPNLPSGTADSGTAFDLPAAVGPSSLDSSPTWPDAATVAAALLDGAGVELPLVSAASAFEGIDLSAAGLDYLPAPLADFPVAADSTAMGQHTPDLPGVAAADLAFERPQFPEATNAATLDHQQPIWPELPDAALRFEQPFAALPIAAGQPVSERPELPAVEGGHDSPLLDRPEVVSQVEDSDQGRDEQLLRGLAGEDGALFRPDWPEVDDEDERDIDRAEGNGEGMLAVLERIASGIEELVEQGRNNSDQGKRSPDEPADREPAQRPTGWQSFDVFGPRPQGRPSASPSIPH